MTLTVDQINRIASRAVDMLVFDDDCIPPWIERHAFLGDILALVEFAKEHAEERDA